MLPDGFELSQGSLQDFVDCRRRFQLRYLRQQAWPAVEVEPALDHEIYSLQGQQFHRLLERYYLLCQTMPETEAKAILGTSVSSGVLRNWWQAFLDEPPLNLPSERVLPEVRMVASLLGHRLVGVFDLMAFDVGERIVIVDWKTSRRRPERDVMLARLQSKVYPVVLVEAGAQYFGGAVDPARVTMVYWFANYPAEPHVFHYSEPQYVRDRAYLEALVDDLASVSAEIDWALTLDVGRCKYCEFRSFCDRGVVAGSELDLFDDFEGFSSLDEVDELEY